MTLSLLCAHTIHTLTHSLTHTHTLSLYSLSVSHSLTFSLSLSLFVHLIFFSFKVLTQLLEMIFGLLMILAITLSLFDSFFLSCARTHSCSLSCSHFLLLSFFFFPFSLLSLTLSFHSFIHKVQTQQLEMIFGLLTILTIGQIQLL